MRRLNLKATSENILTEIKSHTLYDFHGLTESANYDEKTENYVKEHFKFSFEGTRETQKNIANIFLKTLKSMQEEYMLAMNLETPLFYIEKARSKSAPNNTVVIELDIENVKGSFATIVKYAGQHMNQYNAMLKLVPNDHYKNIAEQLIRN